MASILGTTLQAVNRLLVPVKSTSLLTSVIVVIVTLPFLSDPINNIRNDGLRLQQTYEQGGEFISIIVQEKIANDYKLLCIISRMCFIYNFWIFVQAICNMIS